MTDQTSETTPDGLDVAAVRERVVRLADEGWWSDKTVAEIVHEYAVVRGDLVAQYARDQLTEIIERRIADAVEDAREASDNADRWCARVEVLEAELDGLRNALRLLAYDMHRGAKHVGDGADAAVLIDKLLATADADATKGEA